MTTSKDNPHKPGTKEWKKFEHSIMDRQSFILGQEYHDAKAVADKRIKTATDQIRAQEEKGVWVDEILEFLDGDKPEYDEVLDGPVKIVDEVDWKSVNANTDPLNWNQLVGMMTTAFPTGQQVSYATFKPVFKGTIVVPKFIPAAVEPDSLFDKIATLQDYEFTQEEYNKGEVQVPIRTNNLTFVVAEFYIRRKK